MSFTKYKNLHLYTPKVTEEQFLHAASESFLSRFYGGSVGPLLVHFAKKHKLNKADVAELKRILDEEE